eukprot:11622393-Heterocapsa_arctica.AAC.1
MHGEVFDNAYGLFADAELTQTLGDCGGNAQCAREWKGVSELSATPPAIALCATMVDISTMAGVGITLVGVATDVVV